MDAATVQRIIEECGPPPHPTAAQHERDDRDARQTTGQRDDRQLLLALVLWLDGIVITLW